MLISCLFQLNIVSLHKNNLKVKFEDKNEKKL